MAHPIDLKQVRAFVAAAREGNVTRFGEAAPEKTAISLQMGHLAASAESLFSRNVDAVGDYLGRRIAGAKAKQVLTRGTP